MSGAGTLYIAAYYDWKTAYTLTSCAIIVGIIAILTIPKLDNVQTISTTENRKKFFLLKECWHDLFNRPYFVYMAGFILSFKVADTVLNAMSAPFLFELGFTKLECAQISKFFGISLMVTGGLLGGVIIHSLGLNRTIILCALIQSLSCFMFMIQGWLGHDMPYADRYNWH
jgi:PAT family beta-lactamase induction signal transducer AmpG